MVLSYPSAWHHKDLKQAQVCAWNMRSIAAYTVPQKGRIKKELGKIENLQVPRGVEEIERILHSCDSSKESEYDCHARIYVRIGARLSN